LSIMLTPSAHLLTRLGVFLTIGTLVALAPGTTPEPADEPFRILSINPEHPTDRDLDPVLKAIGDARIVVLAAATPGDGAAHWARVRLANTLIERAGFSVIAFEAGFYDCRAMNSQFAAGTDPSLTPKAGLPEQLASSGYMQRLYRNIWKSYFNPVPTEVAGFDYRHTGARTARQLPRDLFRYLGNLDPNPLTKEQRRKYLTVLERLVEAGDAGDDAEIVRSWEQLHELKQVLEANRDALIEAEGEPLYEVWTLILKDAILNAEAAMSFDGDGSTLTNDNTRQKHMGERLLWLAQVQYPDRRIIVFCETLTAIADPGSLVVEPDADLVDGYQSAGQVWRKALGDDLYTIAFTAERGTSGWIQGPSLPVPEAVTSSVEARLAQADWPFLFEPLRGNTDPWWQTPRPSTMTGLNRRLMVEDNLPREQRISADWPEQVDAVFFIGEMFPNNWKAEPPEGVIDTVHIE
jgi:erythromycin esterase